MHSVLRPIFAFQASGYPSNCVTEEQKQECVDEYLEMEGIQLDRGKIGYNPGMRALAKLILNSFWGEQKVVLMQSTNSFLFIQEDII